MYFFRHLATVLFISSFSSNVARSFASEDSRLSASIEVIERSHAVIRNLRTDNNRGLGIGFRNRGRRMIAARNPEAGVSPGVVQPVKPTRKNPPHRVPNNNNNKPPPKEKNGDGSDDHPDKYDSYDNPDPPDNLDGLGDPVEHKVPDGDPTKSSTASQKRTSVRSRPSEATSSTTVPSPTAASPTAASPSSNPPAISTTPTLTLATSTASSSPAASAAAARSSAGPPLILEAFENGRMWKFAMTGLLLYFSVNFVGL